jgi:ATP-dependent protease ClpP protease subunit
MSTVNIFGEIGVDFTAQDMAKFLDFAGDPTITVNIHSRGGSVFDGLAIYDLLIQSKKNVTTNIVGLAGSAAGLIFMAGDQRRMTVGGMLMTHKSSVNTGGNADELRDKLSTVEAIDQRMMAIIKSKTDLDEDRIKQLFVGDTFMGVDEAVSLGLATGIADTESVAACLKLLDDKHNTKKKEPIAMANPENEKEEVGFFKYMAAYFMKDEPKADVKAEDEEEVVEEEEKETEKAMEEGEEKEPKSMDEEEHEEKAMDEEDDPEKMKAEIAALKAKLAEAEAKAVSEEEAKAELEKAGKILDAMSEDKFTMHEAKNLFAKSADEVSAAIESVSANATGRGKTDEPKEDPKASVYEEYKSLQGNEKTDFFNKHKEDIIQQMNMEK